jgi:hypothetical protein
MNTGNRGTGSGTGSGVERGFRELYEPWFKAWLVAAPIVGYGSYRLMRTMWARTVGVLAGEEQSAFSEPVIPEGAIEPPTFVIYGVVAAVVFTIFWIVIARVYVNHSSEP